jgi:CheY-like chemotaxis protein
VNDATLPRTVLVVDDDAALRRLLARMLERMGWTVTTVASGAEALEMLRNANDFHVLLTDVSMPNMSGVELARLVRQENPRMAVLLMSGNIEGRIEVPPIDFHVAGFVDKPFTPNSLLDALQSCTDKSF